MATLMLSLGVPMLLAGDEFGRSQQGNNNAYCQDNEISWLDWQKIRPEDEALRHFVRELISLRRQHRVFSRPRFFRGEVVSEAGLKDITWVTPAGEEATDDDWRNPIAMSLGYVLGGAAGEFFTTGGQRDIDESFLVMMNAYYGDLDFHFPGWPHRSPGRRWSTPPSRAGSSPAASSMSPAIPTPQARSFALFINRAGGNGKPATLAAAGWDRGRDLDRSE